MNQDEFDAAMRVAKELERQAFWEDVRRFFCFWLRRQPRYRATFTRGHVHVEAIE